MVMSSLPKRIRKLLLPTASSSAFSTFFLNWKLVLSPAFKSWLLVFTSALYRTRRWFQCSYFGLFPVSSKQFHNHINPIHSFTEVCHLGMFLWPSFLLIPSFSELHFFFFFNSSKSLAPDFSNLCRTISGSYPGHFSIQKLIHLETCFIQCLDLTHLNFIFFLETQCFKHIFLKPL